MGEIPFKDDIRPEPLGKALSERYLAYALSTITFRALPDARSAPDLEETSARGMLLIRTFMDEVSHNARGNEIRMLKRRE